MHFLVGIIVCRSQFAFICKGRGGHFSLTLTEDSDNSNNHPFVRSLAPSSYLSRLGLDETVDDRIEEDTGNPDAAPQQFHEVEGLAEDEGHTHDDDDALGRVGHGLSHGVLCR